MPGRYIMFFTMLFSSLSTHGNSLIVEVIHNGNIYGRLGPVNNASRVCYHNETNCHGGLPRLVHSVKEIKKRDSDDNIVIHLNTGNTCGNTVLFEALETEEKHTRLCLDVMKTLNADAVSLGDLELERGEGMIKRMLNQSNIPFVTNVDLPTVKGFPTYKIFERKDFNIGVIGFFDHNRRSKLPLLYNSKTLRIPLHLPRVAKEIRKNNVHFIIAFGLLEYESLLNMLHNTDKLKVGEILGVDMIICSHRKGFDHKVYDPESKDDDYPKKIVLTPDDEFYFLYTHGYTNAFGHVICYIDDVTKKLKHCTGRQVRLTKYIPEDADAKKLYKRSLEAVIKYKKKIIGESAVHIHGSACTMNECNLGNVVTDAFVSCVARHYNGTFWTNTSIGLLSTSSILGCVKQNDAKINYFELMDAYKPRGRLVLVTLTGKDLLASLELGAFRHDDLDGNEFLQVSGLHYRYNPNLPRGSRIRKVVVRCAECLRSDYEEIEPNKKYAVVTNQELAQGVDGHYVLRNTILNKQKLNLYDGSCVREYFLKAGKIITGEEGRIIREGRSYQSCGNQIGSISGFVQVTFVFFITILYK